MPPISFKRHRFPPDVIRHAVWLYFRFTLSLRDVEEMLAQRGIDASYEAIRGWTRKFGKTFAKNLRRSRANSSGRWHLDEMVAKIAGNRMWLWRAVDDEGEVLDMLVQKRRNTVAALRLLRKLLKHHGTHPQTIVTDKLASYRSAWTKLSGAGTDIAVAGDGTAYVVGSGGQINKMAAGDKTWAPIAGTAGAKRISAGTTQFVATK